MLFHFGKRAATARLLKKISAYIAEHYEPICNSAAPVPAQKNLQTLRQLPQKESRASFAPEEEILDCAAEPESTATYTRAPMMLSLEDILQQEDAGFTETLLKKIDLTGKKDSEIYKKAGLTKQHFSKIRNNVGYKPTKSTAIALALALELDLKDTKDLIGRAGYALTNSSKFDLIVRYFIEQGVYDVVQINIALYEFDQPLLGS